MGILVALPIAAAIAILDKRRIEEFLFLAIEVIISLIFIAGCFGNTLYGVVAGVILGVCATVYCIVVFIKDRSRVKECVLTPGLLIGVAIIVVEGVMLIGKTDLGGKNDTYMTHVPQVLNMYRYSDMGNVGKRMINFTLLYTAPTYTSWCYFCNRLWFEYSDGINLWAWQIFTLSGFLPFFTFAEKGNYKKQILLTILILILPNIVIRSYDFMPDTPLAAAITYGTIMTIRLFRERKRNNDVGYLLGICMTLSMVCVMKRLGGLHIYGMVSVATVYTLDRILTKPFAVGIIKKVFPLVVMFGAVISSFWFSLFRDYAYERYYSEYLDAYYTGGYNYIMTAIGGFVLFFVMGILFWVFKILFCKKKYLILLVTFISGFFVIKYIMLKLAMKLTLKYDGDPAAVKGVFFRFFEMWFNSENIVPTRERFGSGWVMSDGIYIVILTALIIIVGVFIVRGRLKYEGTVSDLVNLFGTVVMGYTVYMLFFCFVYMIRQGGYLRNSLQFFVNTDRYLGPAVMLVTAVVLYELLSIKSIDHNRILICAVVFLMLLLPDNVFRMLCLDSTDYRSEFEKMCRDAGVELSEDDKVIFLGEDYGYYFAFPADVSQDIDAGECEIEPESWSEQIVSEKYDYLILLDYKRKFPSIYQDMFEGGTDAIKKWAIYDIVIENERAKFILRGQTE